MKLSLLLKHNSWYRLFAGLKKRTFGTFTRPTSPQTTKQAALSSDKHFDRSSFTSCFYFSFAFSSHYTLMWAIIPPVRMTTNYSPTNSRCSQVGHCSWPHGRQFLDNGCWNVNKYQDTMYRHDNCIITYVPATHTHTHKNGIFFSFRWK
jgi:hypothetical protein